MMKPKDNELHLIARNENSLEAFDFVFFVLVLFEQQHLQKTRRLDSERQHEDDLEGFVSRNLSKKHQK